MRLAIGFFLACIFFLSVNAEDEIYQSPCQKDRARRLNATDTAGVVHLIPRCDPNGDYAAKQCFTDSDWCVCYSRNGENINTPSRSIKHCDCIRFQDEARSRGGSYVPKCDESGFYEPKQCEGDECWCVDQLGYILITQTTEDLECPQPFVFDE